MRHIPVSLLRGEGIETCSDNTCLGNVHVLCSCRKLDTEWTWTWQDQLCQDQL